jgi:hypothetical protein
MRLYDGPGADFGDFDSLAVDILDIYVKVRFVLYRVAGGGSSDFKFYSVFAVNGSGYVS